MKKGIGIVVFLGLIAIGIYWYVTREKPIANYPGQGTTIVAFGDSLVAGNGSTEGHDFVSQLSLKSGLQIINKGEPGDTTRDGLKRIDEVLAQYDPKLVILLLGGNDVLQKVPRQETFQNLETIIKKIEDSGSMVLLLGIQGGILGDPYKSEFKRLALTYHTAYVDNVLKDIFSKQEYMTDTVHPNDLGYAHITERIYPILLKLLQ
jgi:acyl-CoA thioesterase-1